MSATKEAVLEFVEDHFEKHHGDSCKQCNHFDFHLTVAKTHDRKAYCRVAAGIDPLNACPALPFHNIPPRKETP